MIPRQRQYGKSMKAQKKSYFHYGRAIAFIFCGVIAGLIAGILLPVKGWNWNASLVSIAVYWMLLFSFGRRKG